MNFWTSFKNAFDSTRKQFKSVHRKQRLSKFLCKLIIFTFSHAAVRESFKRTIVPANIHCTEGFFVDANRGRFQLFHRFPEDAIG